MNKQEVIDKVRQVLVRHPYVVKAELFGSFARGDNTPDSDVDLLVVYDENRPKGFRYFRIFVDMEEALGCEVDIVQEPFLYDFIRENVNRDRELIYERSSDMSHENLPSNP